LEMYMRCMQHGGEDQLERKLITEGGWGKRGLLGIRSLESPGVEGSDQLALGRKVVKLEKEKWLMGGESTFWGELGKGV